MVEAAVAWADALQRLLLIVGEMLGGWPDRVWLPAVAMQPRGDHASGAKASRPELDNVLRLLRDGDTLKITRLDRLGRSVLHLVTLGAELRERGVGLHVIEQGIDTSTAEGCSGCSPCSPNCSASS